MIASTVAMSMRTTNVKIPELQVRMPESITDILTSDSTLLPALILCEEIDYSDEQFYAHLRKASEKLDSMVKKALKEHAKGKTRKFPV